MYALLALCTLTADPLTVEEVEARAIASRRAIARCHVILEAEGRYEVSSGPGSYGKTYYLWLDGDKLRADVVKSGGKPPKDAMEPDQRKTFCRNCLQPGHTTSYSYPRSTVSTVPNSAKGASSAGPFSDLIDPRLLGVVLDSAQSMSFRDLNQILASKDRKGAGVETVRQGNEEFYLVTAKTLKAGADVRIWIAPAKGNMVSRIEASGLNDGKPWVYSIESELRSDAASGVWYPARLTHKRVAAGKTEVEETVKVLHAEFNKPIDPVIFTLEGFKLPVGVPVLTAGRNRPDYWDGSKVVDKPLGPQTPPTPPPPESDPSGPYPTSGMGFPWWYAVAAILFSSAAVLFLRKAFFRRN